jgi:hypothetical protein
MYVMICIYKAFRQMFYIFKSSLLLIKDVVWYHSWHVHLVSSSSEGITHRQAS